MYKRAVASFWTVEEVDLSQDLRDWLKLNGECALAQLHATAKLFMPHQWAETSMLLCWPEVTPA